VSGVIRLLLFGLPATLLLAMVGLASAVLLTDTDGTPVPEEVDDG